MREPTDEQAEAIREASRADAPSIMTKAFAGTGKSTTLEMMAHQIQRPGLALAFNRKIVEELKPRMPDNFTVKSLNGLGHGAWMRRPGMPRLQLDDRKTGKIVTEVLKETNTKASSEQWDWIRQTTSRAMVQGLVPKRYHAHAEAFAVKAEQEDWNDAAAAAEVPSDEWPFVTDLAREVLERDITAALRGIISFDDQVYCPTVLGGSWPRYPTVLCDEVQDLSWLNHMMLQLACKDQLIGCGDELQAIYAFRGADHDSMRNLRKLRPQWTDLRLTMTFRCPKVVVERQQAHARGYRAHEQNLEGHFAHFEPLDEMSGKGGWSVEDLRRFAQGSSDIVVLCRNNGPLMSLAFKLLRRGIGVKMLGRDIGKGLVALSKKVCPTDEMDNSVCVANIQEWQEREASIAQANGRVALVDSINDRAECLLAVLESAEARDAGQLRQLLENLFARDSGLITLSSVHRSKGLEWQTVVHLDPWRIPSKFAKRAALAGDERQMRQEMNLRYVCETRTKEVLIEANLEDFRP